MTFAGSSFPKTEDARKINFYCHPSPHPAKVALSLGEAAQPYDVVPVDTRRGDQHAPTCLAINRNGKTPALVDGDVPLAPSSLA